AAVGDDTSGNVVAAVARGRLHDRFQAEGRRGRRAAVADGAVVAVAGDGAHGSRRGAHGADRVVIEILDVDITLAIDCEADRIFELRVDGRAAVAATAAEAVAGEG